MFHSGELLARKASLGQTRLLGTKQAKLDRMKANKLNISRICEEILNPPVLIALLLSSILMGGVVILYEKKAMFLHDDANRLLVDIRKACKVMEEPTLLPIREENAIARRKSVTLTENEETSMGYHFFLLLKDGEQGDAQADHQGDGQADHQQGDGGHQHAHDPDGAGEVAGGVAGAAGAGGAGGGDDHRGDPPEDHQQDSDEDVDPVEEDDDETSSDEDEMEQDDEDEYRTRKGDYGFRDPATDDEAEHHPDIFRPSRHDDGRYLFPGCPRGPDRPAPSESDLED